MGWKHVQGSGAQASSGSNSTLTATFSGAVASGDLIVVSGAWYAQALGTPTVSDNVNRINYTYQGPTVASGNQNLGTWYYVTPAGALPGVFTITITAPATGGAYISMTIDEFNYATRAAYSIDSSGTITQAQATSISLASALSVTGTDLIYASAMIGATGTASPGPGFTLAYSGNPSLGNCWGIASEYLLSQKSSINPSISFSVVALAALNGIAFKAIAPYGAMLLPG